MVVKNNGRRRLYELSRADVCPGLLNPLKTFLWKFVWPIWQWWSQKPLEIPSIPGIPGVCQPLGARTPAHGLPRPEIPRIPWIPIVLAMMKSKTLENPCIPCIPRIPGIPSIPGLCQPLGARTLAHGLPRPGIPLSLIHISEPTRPY